MKNLLVVFVLLSLSVGAQQMNPLLIDSSLSGHRVILSGIGELQSTAIHRDMENTLLWGGYIDSTMKNSSFAKHNGYNRVGFNVNAEITYQNLDATMFGNENIGWQVKGGYYAVGNLNYQKDMFGLAFYGNQPYTGATADISNAYLQATVFQKIGFGLVDKRGGSSVTLNYVNISDFYGGEIRTGQLSQSADGSTVDLDLRGSYAGTSGSSFSKGAGAAIDIDYRLSVPWFYNRTANFQISAQNLGFGIISKDLTKYEADTTFHYSGFQLNQFSNGNNPIGNNFSLLDSLGVKHSSGSKAIMLPGYIQVGKMVSDSLNVPVQSFFGIRFYPSLKNAPMLFAGAYWKVVRGLAVSASASYGGFGNFRGGLYLSGRVANMFAWSVGTDDVAGVISKRAFGTNVVARLQVRF